MMKSIAIGVLFALIPFAVSFLLYRRGKCSIWPVVVSPLVGLFSYVVLIIIRTFDDDEKLAAYTRQGGNCVKCGKHFAIEEMQADHITPWAKGGKTVAENCQMLCADCNRRKSDA